MTDQSGDPPEGGGRSDGCPPAARRASPSRPGPVERFTAPRQTRAIGGLTSERAAKIVRQSGDARWVAFLGVVIVALFVIVYYFYELGVPIINTTPRLEAEAKLQQVTAVERGYNLYQANCARCHGVERRGRHRAGPERPVEAVRPPQRAVHPERADGRRPVRLRRPEERHAGLARRTAAR